MELCPLEGPRTPTLQGGAEGRTGVHREAGCRGRPLSCSTSRHPPLPASRWKRPHTRPCSGRRRGPAEGGAEPGGAGARPASDSARAAHLVYKGVRPQHRRLVGKFAAVPVVCATAGAHRDRRRAREGRLIEEDVELEKVGVLNGKASVGGHGDRLAYKEVGVRRRGARGLDSRTGEEFRAEAGGKAREAADKGGAAWASAPSYTALAGRGPWRLALSSPHAFKASSPQVPGEPHSLSTM